jgi:hypothetical protein
MKLEENQKLWFVGHGNHARKRGEVTVKSIGRKWAHVTGVFTGRIAVDTRVADAAGFNSPGRCYASVDDWIAQEGQKHAWRSLRSQMPLPCPKNLSYDDIVAAGKLLGFDVAMRNDPES